MSAVTSAARFMPFYSHWRIRLSSRRLLLRLFTVVISTAGLLSAVSLSNQADLPRRHLTQGRETTPWSSNETAYELIVARYNEDVSWVLTLPANLQITIYNKGLSGVSAAVAADSRVKIIQLPFVGKESETYARHCFERYETLAGFTIFSQGDPFEHAPYLISLIRSTVAGKEDPDYVCYTNQYLSHDNMPPAKLLDEYKHVRHERFSLHTLQTIYQHSVITELFMARPYQKLYGLKQGDNIMKDFFTRIGLPEHVPNDEDVANFGYGAVFGVGRARINAIPRQVYSNVQQIQLVHKVVGYVTERAWTILFDRPRAFGMYRNKGRRQHCSSTYDASQPSDVVYMGGFTSKAPVYIAFAEIDVAGSDLHGETMSENTTIADCNILCDVSTNCIATVWKPPRNYCYLKQALTSANFSSTPDRIFSTKQTPADGEVFPEQDASFGDDLSVFHTIDERACFSICGIAPDCSQAVFYKNTVCFLKSQNAPLGPGKDRVTWTKLAVAHQ